MSPWQVTAEALGDASKGPTTQAVLRERWDKVGTETSPLLCSTQNLPQGTLTPKTVTLNRDNYNDQNPVHSHSAQFCSLVL